MWWGFGSRRKLLAGVGLEVLPAARHDAAMPSDLLLDRAREMWAELAGAPVRFSSLDRVNMVVSPHSLLCPPSWTGIVVLGDAGIVTVPSEQFAELIAGAVRELPCEGLVDADRLRGVLPVVDVLGPAALLYLDRADFRPAHGGVVVAEVPGDDDRLAALLARAGAEDAAESGMVDVTSSVWVLRDGADIVAAAGYALWPQSVAHLSVLVAPDRRGRGLAAGTPSRVTGSQSWARPPSPPLVATPR